MLIDSNQQFVDSLQNGPMYVEVGLHPMYFQFYSPECADPVHAGYIRPSFAGVLTGYNLNTAGSEYWELYIRRHGDNFNKVNLACKFYNTADNSPRPPFAGMSSRVYVVEVATAPVVTEAPTAPVVTEAPTLPVFNGVLESIPGGVRLNGETFGPYLESLGVNLQEVTEITVYADCLDPTSTIDFASILPNMGAFTLVIEETDEHAAIADMVAENVGDSDLVITSAIELAMAASGRR